MKVSSLVDASNNLGRHLVLVPPGTIRCSSGTKANQQPFGPNTRRRSVRMLPHGVSQYFCWESGVSIRGCGWFQDSAIDHHDDHTYLLGYANSPKNNLGQLCCLGVVDEQNRLGFYNIFRASDMVGSVAIVLLVDVDLERVNRCSGSASWLLER